MKIRHKSIHEIFPINFQFCRYNFIKFAMNMTALYICIIHNDLFQNSKKQKKKIASPYYPRRIRERFLHKCLSVACCLLKSNESHFDRFTFSLFFFTGLCFIHWMERITHRWRWLRRTILIVCSHFIIARDLISDRDPYLSNKYIYLPTKKYARARTHFYTFSSYEFNRHPRWKSFTRFTFWHFYFEIKLDTNEIDSKFTRPF